VHAAQVSAFHSYEYRGEQLLAQVKTILAISGAQKVNLIGHSMGSPTSRYVSGTIPANVASVTSVGGVNKTGSPVADLLLQASNLPVIGAPATSLITKVVNGFGQFLGIGTGQTFNQDSYNAMTALSSAGTAAFQCQVPGRHPDHGLWRWRTRYQWCA
jgi:triacylglycerol lipase